MIDKMNPLYFKGVRPIPVIPTVYTDALSYGEQLGIIGHKTDECVDKVNEVVDDNNTFKTELTNQQNTFETNITNQQSSFETAITNQQSSFETAITNQQNTYEENTTAGLNTWKTNTKAEYKAQIDGMEAEWDSFLAEYEQTGEVTQNPYGDNALVVTSQKAVNDGLRGFNGIDNILFEHEPVYNKKCLNGSVSTDTNFSYFKIELTSGTTYYFKPRVRMICKQGTANEAENAYSFTPETTADYYLTFRNENDWRMSTNSDMSKVCGFKSKSFSENQLYQNAGGDTSQPLSQNGVMNVHKGLYGSNNLLFPCTVHYNEYKSSGSTNPNNLYSWFEIPMTANTTYYFASEARFVMKEGAGTYISQRVTSFTPSETAIYLVTFQNALAWKVRTTNDFTNTPDYKTPQFVSGNLAQTGGNSVDIPMSQKAVTDAINSAGNSGSVLYGKKWYALGDSFTHGDFTGTSGYTFTDEPYLGQNKVYPFYIGRRRGMNVVNLAVNGMTLATYSGASTVLSNGTYQNVGADADYITIKIGINDSHHEIPIGTINDATNDTFYGAFNIVMSWLIANRPLARIGLIVTNGLDSGDYADATIAIAKKYGVPYINEWNGEQVPVLCRSGRTDVDPSIISARTETYRVSSTNGHPSVYAHERESEFIEEWLKTL